MTYLRRAIRVALVFTGVSLLLLLASAQAAPGWEAGATEPPLDPEPDEPSRSAAGFAVQQVSATVATGGDRRMQAWVVTPVTAATDAAAPGVVLVHGAGSGTRDALLNEARELAAAGVAVMVYDKRGAGYSFLRRDFAQLADDAIHAADVLASWPGVDRRRLGIIGWSEGGWVAPLAVRRAAGRFAFLGLVSAPVVSPVVQSAWVVDQPLVRTPDWVRRVPATVLSAGRPYLRYLDFDVRPALAEIQVPIYAVWGADDAVVPVNVAVRTLLRAVDRPITIRILPDAGHDVGSGRWLSEIATWARMLSTEVSRPAGSGDHRSGPGTRGADDVRGAEPSTRTAVPTLPAPAWFTNPLGQTAAAIAITVALAFRRARPSPQTNGSS